MHMVLGLLIVNQLMLTADRRNQWLYLALGLLFGIALVLTFSRSDLIAYAVGLAMIYSLRRRDRGAILGRWSLQNGAILGVMFAVALQTGLLGHVALTATAPQDQYHSQDISAALRYLGSLRGGYGPGGTQNRCLLPVDPASTWSSILNRI
jgi:O-antigen ligase